VDYPIVHRDDPFIHKVLAKQLPGLNYDNPFRAGKNHPDPDPVDLGGLVANSDAVIREIEQVLEELDGRHWQRLEFPISCVDSYSLRRRVSQYFSCQNLRLSFQIRPKGVFVKITRSIEI
jgi:hypothetical protein